MGARTSTHQKVKFAKELAVCNNIREASEKAGFSYPTGKTYAKTEEIRALVAKQKAKLAEATPKAVQNLVCAADRFDIDDEDDKRRAIAYDANKQILDRSGVTNENQAAMQVNATLLPAVMALLVKHLGEMRGDEPHVINITPERGGEVNV